MDTLSRPRSDEMDPETIDNSLGARLRKAELQHASDKAEWKVKLESALARAKQTHLEKEEIRIQFEEMCTENYKLSRQNIRLEDKNQRLEEGLRTNTLRTQLESELASAARALAEQRQKYENQLATQNKDYEASLTEQQQKYQLELEEQKKDFRKEREEMNRKISVQRSQIAQFREAHKVLVELKEENQKLIKEHAQSLLTQQQNAREILYLREQLKSSREIEKDKGDECERQHEQDIQSLKDQWSQAEIKEKVLSQTILELQNEKQDLQAVVRKQDEELAAWKNTAADLDHCMKELFELESESSLAQMDSFSSSIKNQLEEVALEQTELAKMCWRLENDVIAWKSRCAELETSLIMAKSSGDQQHALELANFKGKLTAQEMVIQKQKEELDEWKVAASKLEQCIQDAITLEKESAASYEDQISALANENQEMLEKLSVLENRNAELQAENAGLRVNDGVGLEAVYCYSSVSKHQELGALTESTTDEGDSCSSKHSFSEEDQELPRCFNAAV